MIQSAVMQADGNTIRVTYDDGTVLWVPDDMANAHRQELEEWSKAEGNVIQPYVAPAQPK